MTTPVYPTLPGLTYDVKRTRMAKTTVQTAWNGKEWRLGQWTYPRYQYELIYSFLRTYGAYTELATFAGFWDQMLGSLGTFLFADTETPDTIVTGQAIGTGDGHTTGFQLQRTYGGATIPVYAPSVISHVYLNGVDQGTIGTLWNAVNYDGLLIGGLTPSSSTPGTLGFATAPGSGVAITADFSYYFPARFADDQMDLNEFLHQIWEAKSVKFITLKD